MAEGPVLVQAEWEATSLLGARVVVVGLFVLVADLRGGASVQTSMRCACAVATEEAPSVPILASVY